MQKLLKAQEGIKRYPWFVEITFEDKTYHYCSCETEVQALAEAERLSKVYPKNKYTVRESII